MTLPIDFDIFSPLLRTNPWLKLPTFPPEEIERYYEAFWRLSHAIRAEKEKRGVFDFLERFGCARIEVQEEPVRLAEMTVHGDTRLAILAHPESRICFDVDPPEGARLAFGITLSPLVWSPEKGKGVLFRIVLLQGGSEVELFSEYIDPKNNPDHRRWHDFDIDLEASPTEPSTVQFITTAPGDSNCHNWAYWGRPYIHLA